MAVISAHIMVSPNYLSKKDGLPSLSSSTGSGPTEYRNCFSSLGRKPLINEDEIGSFEELVKFARGNESLHKRFNVETNPNVQTEIQAYERKHNKEVSDYNVRSLIHYVRT